MDELLERDAELEALRRVAERLPAGRGGFVFVAGEAGIGKTSLLRALRGDLPDGVAFHLGACEPLSVPVPLAPLRELSEAAAGADLAELDSTDRIVLARALLDALGHSAPVVAVVEDAHWADPTTLDVLRLMPRRVEERPIAFVVTYRDDELAANPPLQSLLGDLATNPVVSRLSLRPLSDQAVRTLAAPAVADPERVVRLTGGNPFLVTEMVAAGDRLPETVRDAVLARVGRLEPPARAVVEAAAVAGTKVDPRVLDHVAPGSREGLEQALARGVLITAGPVLGFRHELIRDAVEATIPATTRRELHARVVAALASSSEGQLDHARLAHHAELAGLLAEAARHASAAAEEAQRLGALREVALQSRRALRLGDALSEAQRFELLVALALAENFTSVRLEDALETADEAVRLAVSLADPVREGRAQMARAAALWSLDRVTDARRAAERAVEVLDATDDVELLARAYATLSRMEATAFDPEAALSIGGRALALAERANLDEVRIDLEISIGLARGHQGDPYGLRILERASAAARRAALTIPTVRSYVNMTYVAALQRDHAFLDAKAAEAVELFAELGTTYPAYGVELYRARSLLDRGRWEEAEAIAARDRDWVAETAVALSILGLIAARRGEASAAERIERAWAALREVPESSRHGTVRTALVESAWLRGDAAEMRAQLADARDAPEPWRYARTGGDLAVWAARCGIAIEPPPGAPDAVALELAGDWRGAIAAWRELEAPYEAALAALPGDERAAREAMATLRRLNADVSARAFVRARSAFGGKLPRGPRRTTLSHPAGLTRREQEVLEALATGATNAAIAAALHLSERTVAHHVSAVLGKLEAGSRTAAVERARAPGLLAKSGPTATPR